MDNINEANENVNPEEEIEVNENINPEEKIEANENVNPEEEIENMVESVTEDVNNKCFNFIINASNQANLINTYKLPSTQINAVFILIHPYCIEDFNLEDMNLSIKMNEEGSILIDDKEYKAVEVQPGIKVFGILRNNEE